MHNDSIEEPTNNEDIMIGLEVYSALVYCPPEKEMKLFQFLNKLISTQSPRSIIQATVNTIQNNDIEDPTTRNVVNQFYLALDSIFHFQLGKILLALSSPSDFL